MKQKVYCEREGGWILLVTRLNLAEQLLTELSMYCIDFPKLLGCKSYTIFNSIQEKIPRYFYDRKSFHWREWGFGRILKNPQELNRMRTPVLRRLAVARSFGRQDHKHLHLATACNGNQDLKISHVCVFLDLWQRYSCCFGHQVLYTQQLLQ